MDNLFDVARFLKGKQCHQGMRTGDCAHPACEKARQARELVLLAADLLEPAAQPKQEEAA